MKKISKIGIITIIDYNNYGNRLQNYAVQEVIQDLGFKCETIINYPIYKSKIKNVAYRYQNLRKKIQKSSIIEIAKLLARKIIKYIDNLKNKDLNKQKKEKAKKFREFTKNYIRESNFTIYKDSETTGLNERYDLFVVGSDQVWNPYYRNTSTIDFLKFAEKRKRIAYSASIGVSSIPDEYFDFYRDGINGFSHISLREDSGSKIIKELTNKEVQVTIDPTLMIPTSKWMQIAKPHPQKPKSKYILTYLIGNKSKELTSLIEYYTSTHELDIVHINSKDCKEFYSTDPAEFLDFIKDANIFITDSFHGVIFSILMSTPFINFERIDRDVSMSTRIDTLLKMLKLEHRRYNNTLTSSDYEKLLNTDYQHTEKIIQQKKAEAKKYLMTALNIKQPELIDSETTRTEYEAAN